MRHLCRSVTGEGLPKRAAASRAAGGGGWPETTRAPVVWPRRVAASVGSVRDAFEEGQRIGETRGIGLRIDYRRPGPDLLSRGRLNYLVALDGPRPPVELV